LVRNHKTRVDKKAKLIDPNTIRVYQKQIPFLIKTQ
jgi:hypothetical protein